ncbi:hypothetical protein GEMRC1_009813 [Eukaryota sp. GEM-RC1]
MSCFDIPLTSSRSLDAVSVTDSVEPNVISSSCISFSNPSCASYSPDNSPSSHVHFQQSLLTLIHLHFLSRLFESSLEWNRHEPRDALLKLKKDLLTIFKKVGCVSHHFFESALLATNVFFQIKTFHVVPKDIFQVLSFASFFGADVRSVSSTNMGSLDGKNR